MTFRKYNSNLKPFAKKLRANMTLAEVLLWKRLNRSQLGVRFNRQKPIGKWIVDFYCKDLKLAIEVDGQSHSFKQQEDAERQQQLEALGIRVLRFWDSEIKNDMTAVLEQIQAWIRQNPPRPAATPPQEGNIFQQQQKKIPSLGGVREARGGLLNNRPSSIPPRKRGVALIVVMWVLVIVALIVSSFAFEMKLEAQIITAQRKRLKADSLAQSGIELAKVMLAFEEDPLEGDDIIYDDPWMNKAALLSEGVPVNVEEELGGGLIRLNISFEEGKRGISSLGNDEWKELFEQTGVPSAYTDELLGCLTDWQDKGDEHQLNGAESDDSFYRNRGYECKNAPIDTIDELLLIKGWTEEIVYGTPADKLDEAEYPMLGVAQYLSTWAKKLVNPNAASEEVLRSMYLSENEIEAIMEMRLGPDGEAGTDDDGLKQEDFNALGLDPNKFSLKPEFAKITSEGDVGGTFTRISAVFRLGDKEPTPLFWLEER